MESRFQEPTFFENCSFLTPQSITFPSLPTSDRMPGWTLVSFPMKVPGRPRVLVKGTLHHFAHLLPREWLVHLQGSGNPGAGVTQRPIFFKGESQALALVCKFQVHQRNLVQEENASCRPSTRVQSWYPRGASEQHQESALSLKIIYLFLNLDATFP